MTKIKQSIKYFYNTRYSKKKKIFSELNIQLPFELINIIKDYHHCNKCFLKLKKKLAYCKLCNKINFLKIYNVCFNCDTEKLRNEKMLNDNNNFNYCIQCKNPLVKLIYCLYSQYERNSKDKFYFDKYYKKKFCKKCNTEYRFMK
jgi:hypothetical protein